MLGVATRYPKQQKEQPEQLLLELKTVGPTFPDGMTVFDFHKGHFKFYSQKIKQKKCERKKRNKIILADTGNSALLSGQNPTSY